MDVLRDGRTDSPCVLQDFVTFGAAAQKVKNRALVGVGGGEGVVCLCLSVRADI